MNILSNSDYCLISKKIWEGIKKEPKAFYKSIHRKLYREQEN